MGSIGDQSYLVRLGLLSDLNEAFMRRGVLLLS